MTAEKQLLTADQMGRTAYLRSTMSRLKHHCEFVETYGWGPVPGQVDTAKAAFAKVLYDVDQAIDAILYAGDLA